MSKLRKATDADWRKVLGQIAPTPEHWIGLAVDGRHTVDGLGGIYQAQDGNWWAFMWRAPHCPRYGVTVHRAAKIIVGAAREAGVPLRAQRDHRISSSERWLTRIGFAPTGELIEHEWSIWQTQ